MTEKLYDADPYAVRFSATVLSCIPQSEGFDVTLDRTAFFPEGGGQYGDCGTLSSARVTDTQIYDGVIVHRTDAPVPVGSRVEGCVDWPERFRRMQNHSGEHILSGHVCSRYGFDNVGFHLSGEEMTVDYNGVFTGEMLKETELLCNRTVWEDREILCEYPEAEVLANLEYRSKKELTGPVRIVTVAGVDTCACCAPHVRRTGEIGAIVLLDAIPWKGGTRLRVRCGSDALEEHARLRADEKALSALLSTPRGCAAPAVEKLQKELADCRRAWALAQKENALLRVSALPMGERNVCLVLPSADADVLRAAALAGAERCSGVFVCLSGTDGEGYRYVIASSRVALRSRAREIQEALKGRGGGTDAMLQGAFGASEQQIRDYFKEFQII